MRRTMVLSLAGFMAFLLIPAAFAQEKVEKEAKHQVITRTIDIPGGKAVVKIEIVREGKSAGPRDVDVEVLCPQSQGKEMKKASPPSRAAGKHVLPKGHGQSQIQARSFALSGGKGQMMILKSLPEDHKGASFGKPEERCEVEVQVQGQGMECCEGRGLQARARKESKHGIRAQCRRGHQGKRRGRGACTGRFGGEQGHGPNGLGCRMEGRGACPCQAGKSGGFTHHPQGRTCQGGRCGGKVHGKRPGKEGMVVYGIMAGDGQGNRWYFETDEFPLPPSELAKILQKVKGMKAHPEALHGERGEGGHGECRGEAHGECRGACHDQGHGECRGEAGEGRRVMKRRVEIRVAPEGRACQGEQGKGPRCNGGCSKGQPF